MESGTISTPCIRTSAIVGTHRGAFNLSGGTITITGNSYRGTGEYASFTMDADGADAYSVELNGTLDVKQTVFHNIGHVTGGGKLNITSTNAGFFVFPGGNYDVFMATTGSTIEFMGNNDASLPLKPGNNYKPYQNVIFSGTGKKLISAEDLKVLNNLTIKDAGSVLSNELYNRKITILGSWIDNNTTAIGGFIPGSGMDAGTTLTLGLTSTTNVVNLPTFLAYSLNATSTIAYQGNVGQTISNKPVYGNLTLTSGTTTTTKDATGNYTVAGNLVINNTAILALGTAAATWNIAGSVTIDGTLNYSTTIAKTVNISGDLVNVTGTITMDSYELEYRYLALQ